MRQSKVIGEFRNQNGYLIYRLKNGKCIPASKYIWQEHNSKIPDGFEVDHIDNNIHNNDISNFQLLSKDENLQKRIYDSITSIKGETDD